MWSLLIIVLALGAETQQPAKVEFQCTPDDMEQFGLSCTRPCPVYLELTAADSVAGRILVTGNLHTDSATLYSVLLATEDGGRTWSEPHARIPSAALEQIEFVDLQNGWVSGQTVRNLPRDPFFLTTADGGKSWKQKPVWEEPRVGAIEQFWFESKDSGQMIVDLIHPSDTGGRHEKYQTMTGGDSWALQEVSAKALALKTGSHVSAWRVRADGPSKTYRLEKAVGEGAWETVSKFPIEVGACRGE